MYQTPFYYLATKWEAKHPTDHTVNQITCMREDDVAETVTAEHDAMLKEGITIQRLETGLWRVRRTRTQSSWIDGSSEDVHSFWYTGTDLDACIESARVGGLVFG